MPSTNPVAKQTTNQTLSSLVSQSKKLNKHLNKVAARVLPRSYKVYLDLQPFSITIEKKTDTHVKHDYHTTTTERDPWLVYLVSSIRHRTTPGFPSSSYLQIPEPYAWIFSTTVRITYHQDWPLSIKQYQPLLTVITYD